MRIKEAQETAVMGALGLDLKGFIKVDMEAATPNISADQRDACNFMSVAIIHNWTA